MRVACISDLHGYLPEPPIGADITLIAGDVEKSGFSQDVSRWLKKDFSNWLSQLPNPIGIAGNHDRVLWQSEKTARSLPWTYLLDSHIDTEVGIVHGSPWTLPFMKWYFMLEEAQLAEKWQMIPEDTRILLVHGPPFGYLDTSSYGNDYGVGSSTLTSALYRLNFNRKNNAIVFGHIHECRGIKYFGNSICFNVSYVDDAYESYPTAWTYFELLPMER